MRKYTLSKKTRHIASGYQEKKPFFTKKVVWGILLAAVMAFSIVGFIYIGPQTGNLEYNGIEFQAQGNPQTGVVTGWTAIIDEREISFYNHPTDVLSINVSEEIEQFLRSAKVLIVTSDPNDTSKEIIGLIRYEFQTILSASGVAVLGAFTANNTHNQPTMTCENATTYEPVIYFRTTPRMNQVGLNNSCITIEASTKAGFIRMRDRLLYAHYAVIP